jgi:phospholipid/cholesterol/gamma-HCH transport system ATP-binding protein
MIEIQNIAKRFGEKVVLDGVSAVFERGKTSLIIGASGTGKSVLLKCIVGLIPPDNGNVIYDQQNFYQSGLDVRKTIRREIGMLFQGGALFDSQTVEENVRFPLDMLSNMSMADKLERVNFCLSRVGLESAAKKMPSELSGGMKKRVGIARAIVMNPRYLFCDEPNSGLDPVTSIKIDELIQEITQEFNITTIVVTHDMNSLLGIGDYIMFLYNGKKNWEGNKDNVLSANSKELMDFVFANKMIKNILEK